MRAGVLQVFENENENQCSQAGVGSIGVMQERLLDNAWQLTSCMALALIHTLQTATCRSGDISRLAGRACCVASGFRCTADGRALFYP